MRKRIAGVVVMMVAGIGLLIGAQVSAAQDEGGDHAKKEGKDGAAIHGIFKSLDETQRNRGNRSAV